MDELNAEGARTACAVRQCSNNKGVGGRRSGGGGRTWRDPVARAMDELWWWYPECLMAVDEWANAYAVCWKDVEGGAVADSLLCRIAEAVAEDGIGLAEVPYGYAEKVLADGVWSGAGGFPDDLLRGLEHLRTRRTEAFTLMSAAVAELRTATIPVGSRFLAPATLMSLAIDEVESGRWLDD